jgi:hypothetical protein
MVTATASAELILGAGTGYSEGGSLTRPGHAKYESRINAATPNGEDPMTTFDEREKSFEKKFAHDQDLKFKAESRRNKMIAEWAAAKLGITGAAIDDYVKSVRKADLIEKGHDDVVRKISKDFSDKGIQVAETEIRNQMSQFLSKAVADIEAGR